MARWTRNQSKGRIINYKTLPQKQHHHPSAKVRIRVYVCYWVCVCVYVCIFFLLFLANPTWLWCSYRAMASIHGKHFYYSDRITALEFPYKMEKATQLTTGNWHCASIIHRIPNVRKIKIGPKWIKATMGASALRPKRIPFITKCSTGLSFRRQPSYFQSVMCFAVHTFGAHLPPHLAEKKKPFWELQHLFFFRWP